MPGYGVVGMDINLSLPFLFSSCNLINNPSYAEHNDSSLFSLLDGNVEHFFFSLIIHGILNIYM